MRLRLPTAYRPILRSALFLLALPCVYLGGAVAAYYIRHRAAARTALALPLPVALAPDAATRLFVFAPHNDDEVLGCAGLIQQTLQQGGVVQVGILTNGDGFPTAVERQVRDLRVGPKDYLQFAALRQQESRDALAQLGVAREHALFFGYPDRGLLPLWNAYWTPQRLYVSPTTKRDAVPYADAVQPNAPYCGQSLLENIKRALIRFRPTRLAVTHPADDHPDHAAAAAFVARALQEVQADPEQATWAQQTQLRYYLIHRGDWPPSLQAQAALNPPREMARLDTTWATLPMAEAETSRKRESLRRYATQMAMMQPFLTSFVRSNELFGELPNAAAPTVAEGTIRLEGNSEDWGAVPPAILSPVRDNVARELQGGADIRALYACRDKNFLYLRVDMRRPLARRATLTLHLRLFGAQNETTPAASVWTVPLGRALDRPDGLRTALHDRMAEIAIPLTALTPQNPQTLAVSAETTLSRLEIDQTGFRFLNLTPKGEPR